MNSSSRCLMQGQQKLPCAQGTRQTMKLQSLTCMPQICQHAGAPAEFVKASSM